MVGFSTRPGRLDYHWALLVAFLTVDLILQEDPLCMVRTSNVQRGPVRQHSTLAVPLQHEHLDITKTKQPEHVRNENLIR